MQHVHCNNRLARFRRLLEPGNKKVRGETRGAQASWGKAPLRMLDPQLTCGKPLNGVYGSFSPSLSYYALQPTLVPSPSPHNRCRARVEGQAAPPIGWLPQQTRTAPRPRIRPRRAPRRPRQSRPSSLPSAGTAAFPREHPAGLRAEEGPRRRKGRKPQAGPDCGGNKIALNRGADVIFVGL